MRRILAGAGLTEADLGCPEDLPLGRPERHAWLRARPGAVPGGPQLLRQACGDARDVQRPGWDPRGYLAPDHPLQRAVRDEVQDRTGEAPAGVSVDGCGAPLFRVSLTALARAVSSVITAEPGSAPRRVADAMRAHPQLVAGTGRDVTAWMTGVPGLLAKDGAEGVFAVALADGRACALKVEDGAERARPVVVAAVLAAWGVDADVVGRWATAPVIGGGVPVGEVRASDELTGALV